MYERASAAGAFARASWRDRVYTPRRALISESFPKVLKYPYDHVAVTGVAGARMREEMDVEIPIGTDCRRLDLPERSQVSRRVAVLQILRAQPLTLLTWISWFGGPALRIRPSSISSRSPSLLQ